MTYSLSLKQYAIEFYASVYSFRFLQKYLSPNEHNNPISRYCFVSVILILFSFVNAIPFFLTIFFIFLNEKRINFNLIIFPFLAILPFSSYIIAKLQRVSGNGYWDNFFITNELTSFQNNTNINKGFPNEDKPKNYNIINDIWHENCISFFERIKYALSC